MEELKDIKGLITIEDYSLYIFLLIVVVFLIILYLIIKKILNFKRELSPVKVAKKELKNIDLLDSKKSAYMLSKYAPILCEENFDYLEKYKYRKTVVDFKQEDLEKIKRFLDGI